MLTQSQTNAIEIILKGHNVLLTGSPGTGKSYILQYIINKNLHRKLGITATTGCAAININGTTIHSFFGLKPNQNIKKHTEELIKRKNATYKKLYNLEILIIDEVSMLDNILCDEISFILKTIKQNEKEFGGIQVIFVGDFFQLPPVSNTFCFTSNSWINLNPKIVELKEIVRQSNDKLFQLILAKLRYGNMTKQIYEILEKNINISFNNSDIKPTILYPNNVDVDLINKKELDKLKGKSKVFLATYNKKVNNYLLEKLKDYNILLCVGAQIMITKNISIENELINGTRGMIIDIKETSVIIKTENNIYEINLYSQDVPNDYVKNLKILFMPIKLAYAITIHKSQGATIDYLSIDIGKKIFSYGQAYTALSRGKSLKNINIISLDEMAFQAHPIVLKWINQHH